MVLHSAHLIIYGAREYIQYNKYEKVTCNALLASGFRIALRTGRPGIVSTGVQGFSLLHSARTDFGAHPGCCLMGYWGLFPRPYSVTGVMLTTHTHLVQRSRKVELYLHSPICLHDIVLN
jgi:hypothetical protein